MYRCIAETADSKNVGPCYTYTFFLFQFVSQHRLRSTLRLEPVIYWLVVGLVFELV